MTDIVCSTLMAIRMVESLCSESVPFSLFFGDLQSCMVSMSLRRFHRSRSSTSLSFSLSSLVLTIRCHIFGQLATSLSSASSHWTSLFALFLLLFFLLCLLRLLTLKLVYFSPPVWLGVCLRDTLQWLLSVLLVRFSLSTTLVGVSWHSFSSVTAAGHRHKWWAPVKSVETRCSLLVLLLGNHRAI